ncbi:MAG: hypothetical protein P8171_20760 [Candidatus Thiodiazotropha sp.]
MNDIPYINPVPPADQLGKVEQLLAPFEAMLGRAPDALRLLSVSPPILENYIHNIHYYIAHGELGPVLTGMIRLLSSDSVACKYCIDLNQQLLLNEGIDLETLQRSRHDADAAPLDEKNLALLKLVQKAVTQPHETTPDDFAAVRDRGWSDRNIFEAIYHGHSSRAFAAMVESLNLKNEGALA